MGRWGSCWSCALVPSGWAGRLMGGKRVPIQSVSKSFIGSSAAALLLLATSATAQSSAGYSDVPDRFRMEVGGFRIGADSDLTFNASGSSTPVDFEALNLPDKSTRAYFEAFWRPWRRHQFSLGGYRNNRDGEPATVEREFAWGDRVVTVGTTVKARVNSFYLSGVYRFAAYKGDRFEIGPSLGIGHLSIEAAISGQASVTAAGTVSAPFEVSKGTDKPTGGLGGYLYWWPTRRLLVHGDLRYIIVKPGDSEASLTDGRAAALYHPWRNFAIGLQYMYTKVRYDPDTFSEKLGGSLRYQGGQLVLSAAF